MYDPSRSPLAGMATPVLQANLAAAQNAYSQLMSGAKVVTATYSQGDGSRTVQYNMTSCAQLLAYIQQLQAQLGIVQRPRRPIRLRFR